MNIKEILFWVFLIISAILLIWYLLGNSPSEFFAIVSIILMLTFKVWSVSDRSIKLEMRFNLLASNTKEGFQNIKNDMDLIKKKLKI